ncbi:MAG: hypothetical protein WCV90_09045 [Candidatus Woesearchaeota archaeon]|jgi:hypothetical protein
MTPPQLLDTKTADVMKTIISQEDETKDERYYLTEYFSQRPALNAIFAPALSGNDAADVAEIVALNIANKHFEVLGTNAVTASVTFDSTNAGILLTSAGASADQVIIAPHLDTNQTAWTNVKWGTENQTEWTASLKTGAAITTVQLWAGLKLTNTGVIATDADQVFFRYNTTDNAVAVWHVISSINNTDTDTTTAVAVAVDTQYKFKITIDSSRIARCYINDVLVYTTTALKNDVDLIPYVGVEALDTAAVTAILNYEKINRVLFE